MIQKLEREGTLETFDNLNFKDGLTRFLDIQVDFSFEKWDAQFITKVDIHGSYGLEKEDEKDS
jgi:hypothetical protein